MPYSENERRVRENLYQVFPQMHFTIMSVVQGVATGFLASNLSSYYIKDACVLGNWPPLLYAFLSFSGMIVITFEYSYYVALVRRPPFLTDLATPTILGTAQIGPLFFLCDPEKWWLLTGVFAFTGITAYFNTLTKAEYEYHSGERDQKHETIDFNVYKLCTWRHLCCVAIISSASFLNWFLYYIKRNGEVIEFIMIFITSSMMACTLYVSQLYLRPLYQKLGMEKSRPLRPWTGTIRILKEGGTLLQAEARQLAPRIWKNIINPFD